MNRSTVKLRMNDVLDFSLYIVTDEFIMRIGWVVVGKFMMVNEGAGGCGDNMEIFQKIENLKISKPNVSG